MGLRASGLKLLLPHMPAKRVLSLSYPDLVMSSDELFELTGKRVPGTNRDGAKWHYQHRYEEGRELPDTIAAFKALGTETFRCVDVLASRGVEQIADLNQPQQLGQWDMVIDPGTLEHCFNIGQALINAAEAVRPGGIIFHSSPLTMLNHGFYCLQPTLFHDFYGQNNWDLLTLAATDGFQMRGVPSINRFEAIAELSLYVVARRLTSEPLKFPTQSKYLANPGLS